MVKDIIKEDLKVNNPIDMMVMGAKVLAAKKDSKSKANKELEQLSGQVMRRIEKLYKAKMVPVLEQLAKE